MQYFKTQDGNVIEYDSSKRLARVFNKTELQAQVSNIDAEIANVEVTQQELLEWAENNHPTYKQYQDSLKQKQVLETKLSAINLVK